MIRDDGSYPDSLLNESRELVRRALLSEEEFEAVATELNRDADLTKIALVVLQLSFESKRLVEELLNRLDLPTLVERLDAEENIEVIRRFFSYVGQATGETVSSWVPGWLAESMNKDVLVEKLSKAALEGMEPVYFLESVGSVNSIVARELALKMSWEPLIGRLSDSEDLTLLALCLRCLLGIDPLLIEEFLKKVDVEKFTRVVEKEREPRKLEDILLCVFAIRKEGVAYDFVWSVIKAAASNLAGRELKDMKLFLTRMGGNEVIRVFVQNRIENRKEIISVLLECIGSEKLALKVNGEANRFLVESFLRKIVRVNPILAVELKEKVSRKYKKYLEDLLNSTETYY